MIIYQQEDESVEAFAERTRLTVLLKNDFEKDTQELLKSFIQGLKEKRAKEYIVQNEVSTFSEAVELAKEWEEFKNLQQREIASLEQENNKLEKAQPFPTHSQVKKLLRDLADNGLSEDNLYKFKNLTNKMLRCQIDWEAQDDLDRNILPPPKRVMSPFAHWTIDGPQYDAGPLRFRWKRPFMCFQSAIPISVRRFERKYCPEGLTCPGNWDE